MGLGWSFTPFGCSRSGKMGLPCSQLFHLYQDPGQFPFIFLSSFLLLLLVHICMSLRIFLLFIRFIYTCLAVGIAVSLSTLSGHMVANCISNYTLCVVSSSFFFPFFCHLPHYKYLVSIHSIKIFLLGMGWLDETSVPLWINCYGKPDFPQFYCNFFFTINFFWFQRELHIQFLGG